MSNLGQDLRYALRMLAKSPGFTTVAVLTLAIGVGANTAIFSVVNGVVLRPLPYQQPDRLMVLSERSPQFEDMSVSYLNFLDWRSQNRSFEDVAAFRPEDFNLTGSGDPERLRGRMVSAGFFPVLGVRPVAGRFFTEQEDRPGGAPVAVLGEGVWKRRFGAGRTVLGRPLTLNGKNYTVVGIVPANFRFFGAIDVFVPIGQWDDSAARKREFHPGIRAVGRLRPGVSIRQAKADLANIARRLAEEYPIANAGHGVTITPLKDRVVGEVRPTLWVLAGAVAFVLLIACVNVANLLLARSTVRQKEIAIRTALGANRGRIVGQLLTESVLLACLGGALGLALAAWGTDAMLAAVPQGLPRMDEIGIDGRVLWFTLLVSVLTGILFGLAPALQTSGLDPNQTLKETGRGATGSGRRFRDVLVVCEIALALVLLAGAGLMIRSVLRLNDVNPGLDPRGVLTFQVALSPANSASAQTVRITFPQLLDRIKNVAGVEAAAITLDLPFIDDSEMPFWLQGEQRPSTLGDMHWALFYPVSPDYLRVMRVPLLRGRFFNEHDNERSQGVTVIDEELARGLFAGRDAVGKLLMLTTGKDEVWPLQIIGVVGHVKHWGLDADAQAKIRYQFYFPYAQIPDQFMRGAATGSSFVVRTALDPLSVASAVRAQVTGADRDQPVYNVQTMEQIISGSMAQRRFSMLLLGLFAAIALLLATVGIYAVISYAVGQRTQEIGIRMALGASEQDVLRVVVGHGTVLALTGVALGTAAALVATRAMSSLLFGVTASDPTTFIGVAAVLTAAALLAAWFPARRAAKTDPMAALRYE